MARIFDPEGREMEALAGLVSLEGKDVLDLGCGEGRTAWRIARTAASVLGVDPDEERIAVARGSATDPGSERCNFLVADVVALDLSPAAFDVVVFTRSL